LGLKLRRIPMLWVERIGEKTGHFSPEVPERMLEVMNEITSLQDAFPREMLPGNIT